MSRSTYQAVNAYFRNAFHINQRLSRYFSPHDIIYFRQWLQADTGMLISGSTALQFFDRTDYPDSDLDIYVEQRHAFLVAKWLLLVGYTFVARKSQDPNLRVAFEETPTTFHEGAGIFPSEEVGYFGRGVAGVFNFHKYQPDRKIQLITSLHSPMEIILHFHSSADFASLLSRLLILTIHPTLPTACVMNVISHNFAYSFYPLATFEQRRSLICATSGSKQDEARAKYVSRGWTMEGSVQPWEMTSRRSDFRMGNRWIGDRSCWNMEVLPELDGGSALFPDFITSTSWRLSYSRDCEARSEFLILQTPALRYNYLLADEEAAKFIDTFMKLLPYEWCVTTVSLFLSTNVLTVNGQW